MNAHETIWQEQDEGFPLIKSFTAVLIPLSPVLMPEELNEQLIAAVDELKSLLDPWVRHYAWDYSPPTLEVHEKEGVKYAVLTLQLGELMHDEWLITWMLYQISSKSPDLYIQAYDTEGEFLLMESWEQLPEWVSPEVTRNRIWINTRRLIIIPEVYYSDRSLQLHEAMKFLERASYRCLPNSEIDAVLAKKLEAFPQRALEGQVLVDVRVEKVVPELNELVWDKVKEMAMGSGDHQVEREARGEVRKVRFRVETYLLLKLMLEKKGLADFTEDGGSFLNDTMEGSTSPEVERSDGSDELQDLLLHEGVISDKVEPVLEFGKPDKAEEGDEEQAMIDKLEAFFRDADVGEEEEEEEEEDHGGSESDEDDEDKDAREFLAKEKADIDEDDFFEFFAKEALKLKDEDLEGLRREDNQASHDIEDMGDSEDEFPETGLTEGELEQSIKDLLKSLKGGMGPVF